MDGIFAVCGVPDDKFRAVCSAVDKLDKTPWTEVQKEMVETKGISIEVTEKIWSYVQRKGGMDLIDLLLKDTNFISFPVALQALQDMKVLFTYIEIFGITDISFDLSLARGLDYYTGMIMETILDAADGVGSVAGGGRYDELVAMFSGGHRIPCVGFSFGIERIFAIMEAKMKQNPASQKISAVQVLVASIGDNLLEARMKLCAELWKAGIPAEFLYKKKPKLLDQFEYCERNFIPLVVVIGQDELDANMAKLKSVADREDKGTLLPRSELVTKIKELLQFSPLLETDLATLRL